MSISPQDAAAALRQIEQAQARSAKFRGYQFAAPHFILWGLLWVVGYGLTDVFPRQASAIWGGIIPIGIIAGLVALRGSKRVPAWRHVAFAATISAFFAAAFFVMSPVTGRQIAAFIPLVIATSYVLAGLWGGLRYVVVGLVVAAATLIGFSYLHQHFFLWMAGVGGASLVLAGVWFRQA